MANTARNELGGRNPVKSSCTVMLLFPHHGGYRKGIASTLTSSVGCETPTHQEVTWTCSQHVCGCLPFPSASVWYFVSALPPLRHVCGRGDAAQCLPFKDSSWKKCMVSNLWFYILL